MRLLMVRSALALGLAIPLLSAGTPANAADAVCYSAAAISQDLSPSTLTASYFASNYVLSGVFNQNAGISDAPAVVYQVANNYDAVGEFNALGSTIHIDGWNVLNYAC